MSKEEILQAIKNNEWFCFGAYDDTYILEVYEELKKQYKYFVTAKDKFLSGWGYAENKTSFQMIFCKDVDELNKVMSNLRARSNEFSHINYNYTSNKRALMSYEYKYVVTYRNDFKN